MYTFTSMQLFSQQIYIVPGPVKEAENRTMTKGGKDPLSGASVPVGEEDEKPKYTIDGGRSNIKNSQVG